MEVARAEDEGNDEEEAYPRIQCAANDPPHQSLAQSADKGEHIAHEVELANLEHMSSDLSPSINAPS